MIAPSAKNWLAAMDSTELLRRAADLRELTQQPGWEFLVELIGVQAAHVEGRSERSALLIAAEMAKDAMGTAVKLALAGGQARGLREFESTVAATLEFARRTERQIQVEAGERV